jgi:hypothetical protein
MSKQSERGAAGKYPYRYKYKDRMVKEQGGVNSIGRASQKFPGQVTLLVFFI